MIFPMKDFNVWLLALILWTIPWKAYAVWIAAKADHKKWFVVLLFINTVGILEIFYIFKIAKKTTAEVKADFTNTLNSKIK
jgi:hypothetical protein